MLSQEDIKWEGDNIGHVHGNDNDEIGESLEVALEDCLHPEVNNNHITENEEDVVPCRVETKRSVFYPKGAYRNIVVKVPYPS
jgi:hypothetical protein